MLRVMQALRRSWMVISAPQAGAVARELSEQPEQRNAEFLRSGLKVAIATGEIVAGKAFGGIRNLGTNMGVGRRDQVAPALHQATMGIVRERPDLGHGPGLRAGLGLLRGGRRHPASLGPS